MDIKERIQHLLLLQEEYQDFTDFLYDGMEYLGFPLTWMQRDIGRFIADPLELAIFVAACRGEAKSTIACLYGVWCLIHDPRHRFLLVSGSADKAVENGTLIHGLIHNWPRLACLKPDRTSGDRVAVTSFDVYGGLKGVDKSASVTCLGITSSLQGYRADTLCADDVETTRNGLTPTMREQLTALTREFSSICTNGKIIYLGTPQTKDSIYNNLPARGFKSRIWPARFPTIKQEEQYGEYLAPSIVERMKMLGEKCRTGKGVDLKQGWPTDPERYTEEVLVTKEIDQGPEGFQLQFMLNTSLADAARQQLKSRQFIVLECECTKAPETLVWEASPKTRIKMPEGYLIPSLELFRAGSSSDTYVPLSNITMTVDPAANGGDSLAYCVGGTANSYLHVTGWGALKGGLSPENMTTLYKKCIELGVKTVFVEKNFGSGLALTVLQAHFMNECKAKGIGFTEKNSTGQKERRIINTVRPLLDKHKLVLRYSAFLEDFETTRQWAGSSRIDRVGMHQLINITTDRGCLKHDDNIDALAMLCSELGSFVSVDEDKAAAKRKDQEMRAWLENPMNYNTAALKQMGLSKSKSYRGGTQDKTKRESYRGTRRRKHY